MAQPVAGDQYFVVGTLGTTLVSDVPVVLKRVIVTGTYVGSVSFYDSATVAGTSATNLVYTAGLPATAIPQSPEFNVQFRNGMIATALGTPTLTFTVNK